MLRRFGVLILTTLVVTQAASSQRCNDQFVLDGSEPVVSFGIDTTGHWWAITSPFSQLHTLYVDGDKYGPFHGITPPVFSPTNSGWVTRFLVNQQRGILTPNGGRIIDCDTVTDTFYSADGNVIWTVFRRGHEWLARSDIDSFRMLDPLHWKVSIDGMGFAYVGRRGTGMAAIVNGVEGAVNDEVRLCGYWHDGDPVLITRTGSQWQLSIGSTTLVEGGAVLLNCIVNRFGTVLAAQVSEAGGNMFGLLYDNSMVQPWRTPPLDRITNLVMHPSDALIAYVGEQRSRRLVGFNAALYPGGRENGPLAFTHDGSNLVYVMRDADNNIVIDGKAYRVSVRAGVNESVAMDPLTRRIAYSSTSTMVLVDPEEDSMELARMMDEMGVTIFDWRKRRFVALGLFGGRLTRIECRP